MTIIDLRNFSCMTLRLNLGKLVKCSQQQQGQDKGMSVLSLLNRSQNKALFLRYLKELLLSESLNLVQISLVFMKINSVYK